MTTASNIISRRVLILCIAVATGALVLFGQSFMSRAQGPSHPPCRRPANQLLAEVRAAAERFRDVNVALAEGYIRDPGNICETAEMMGKPAAPWRDGYSLLTPPCSGFPDRPIRV